MDVSSVMYIVSRNWFCTSLSCPMLAAPSDHSQEVELLAIPTSDGRESEGEFSNNIGRLHHSSKQRGAFNIRCARTTYYLVRGHCLSTHHTLVDALRAELCRTSGVE
jgi:hypothetical protein